MTTTNANEQTARDHGREAGEAAATWTIDGNTSADTVAIVLALLNEGDPAVYDMFRSPDLSGEMAGESINEISADGGWEPTDEALDAWTEGSDEAFWSTVERLFSEASA